MSSLAFSSAGSTVSISAAIPATYDDAGFTALTFTKIGEVTDIGALGPVTAMVSHTPVDDPFVYKIKTVTDSGQLSLQGARVTTDAGQMILIAGQASFAPQAIKITLQNGTVLYVQGLVLSYQTTVGAAGVVTSFTSDVALSGKIITVD